MSEGPTTAQVEVTISNRQGLHARPVLRFVDLASGFSSAIKVQRRSQVVDGKSPMEMMLLEGTPGTVLRIIAQGADAQAAVAALATLVNGGFGET